MTAVRYSVRPVSKYHTNFGLGGNQIVESFLKYVVKGVHGDTYGHIQ